MDKEKFLQGLARLQDWLDRRTVKADKKLGDYILAHGQLSIETLECERSKAYYLGQLDVVKDLMQIVNEKF